MICWLLALLRPGQRVLGLFLVKWAYGWFGQRGPRAGLGKGSLAPMNDKTSSKSDLGAATATAAARRALQSSPQTRAVAGEPAFASLRCLPSCKNILLSPPLSVDFSLPVNHLRTQCASQVLLEGVDRAGERQNFLVGPPELLLRQVPFFPVNHLRTQVASEVLLTGLARSGE